MQRHTHTGFNSPVGGGTKELIWMSVSVATRSHHSAYQPDKTCVRDQKSSVMSHQSLGDPLHL